MDEYSRILIEEYCSKHKTKKSKKLEKLVKISYDMTADVCDLDAIFLEKIIENENNPRPKETLEDLNDFLFYCF